MAATRRVGTEFSATRALILDTTEQLMVKEGYAAVSTRRVAAQAGLKPALVHYYFVTTDDLFLATYRRAADRYFERLTKALSSSRPLKATWELSMSRKRTTLAVEFMALANHRKSIRAEIARNIERTRQVQTDLLSGLPCDSIDAPGICPPVTASVLIAALSRALVMEHALGVSSGHAEAQAFAEEWIRRCEGKTRQARSVKRPSAPRRS